jgi:hypothetical protein
MPLLYPVFDQRMKDTTTDVDCYFNYIIGLPQKDGNDMPLYDYDYEQIIFDSLVAQNNNKHLWIKKATGLMSHKLNLLFLLSINYYYKS